MTRGGDRSARDADGPNPDREGGGSPTPERPAGRGPARRDVLAGLGATLAGVGGVGALGGVAGAASDVTVRLEDQTTDGYALEVAELRADGWVSLTVYDGTDEEVLEASMYRWQQGLDREDFELPLQRPLQEDQTVQLTVWDTGSTRERAYADVTVEADAPLVDGTELQRVDARPEAGFEYPYFLWAPPQRATKARPILVEPNNSGTTSDAFEFHAERARTTAEKGQGRDLAEVLTVPLLVPVFPRPSSDPVDETHYVHALDTETMRIEDGPLERVDLQLLAMVEDAQRRLRERGYPVTDELCMNGFSASGNFVNRFAALHPDRVRAVTAGAINGTAVLPIESAAGHTLNYQIGVADVEELTGEPFDRAAFAEVSQLLYMGEHDRNDTIPYDDAWSDRQREVALDVYGEDMQADRMPYCESVYRDVGADARFEIYEGVGHSYDAAIQRDLVAFHREHLDLEGDRVSAPPQFAVDVVAPDQDERVPAGADVAVEVVVENVGEEAGTGTVRLAEPVARERTVEELGAGETTTVTFDVTVPDADDAVWLTVSTAHGEDETWIRPTSPDDATDADGGAADADGATDGNGTVPANESAAGDGTNATASDDTVPGPGVLGALGGLLGGSALARRWRADPGAAADEADADDPDPN